MGYAVLHSEKGKSGSGGIGNHIDRKKGMEHTFPHADDKLIDENVLGKVYKDRQKISMPEAINERIKEGYKGKKAIRKDAVKFTTHVLSGSHEDMKAIFKDKEKAKEWVDANYAFASKEFGEKNIVRFNLHLDEKTPHIHVVTVPLTEDGRLSAREMFGNKTDMQKRQDRYGEEMKPFGLQRGERRTGIKHEDAKAYYTRMNLANAEGLNKENLTVKKKVLGIETGIDKDKTLINFEKALNAQKVALKSKSLELEQTKQRLKEAKKSAEITSQKYDSVLSNDEKYLKEQAKKIENAQKNMRYAVKRKIETSWKLHKITPAERKNIAIDAAIDEANKLDLGQNLFDKSMKNGFKESLFEAVEKRAEKNQERELNRGRNRGHGFSR
jgi:hypothetical protein